VIGAPTSPKPRRSLCWGVLFSGEGVPIIEDYDEIAKRLRELNLPATPAAKNADLDKWRDFAKETARVYVEDRRKDVFGRPTPGKSLARK
jgi:hypothetical protein